TPLPKDKSILALRGPLHAGGTFANPKIGLEKGPLARKIGASVLLGLLNPLAAIIPLIETGPGKDANCGQLVAAVQASAGQSGGKAAPAAPAKKITATPAPAAKSAVAAPTVPASPPSRRPL